MYSSMFTLEFNFPEFYFIKSLLKPTNYQWPELKSTNQSPEDIDRTIQNVEKTLSNRGYIELLGEDEIFLDTTVAGMVGTLLHSSAVLILELFKENNPASNEIHYHFASGFLLEHKIQNEQHLLTAIRNQEILLEHLQAQVISDISPQSTETSLSKKLPEDIFQKIPYIVAGDGPDKAIGYLEQQGTTFEFAKAFVKALSNPIYQANIELMGLEDEKVKLVDKLTIIEDIYNLWVLRHNKSDRMVSVMTAGIDIASNQLTELIDLAISYMV